MTLCQQHGVIILDLILLNSYLTNKDVYKRQVWNWDEQWKVEWYENGKRMGEMQRYKGYDLSLIHI